MRRVALALMYFGLIALIIFLADRSDSQFIFAWIRAIPGGDKVGHFILIGGFAFVVNYSLSCREFRLGTRHFLLGSAIVLALTVAEEFSQIFIPYRTFDLVDLLFDFLGIWNFGLLAKRLLHKPIAEK
jgi:VanZ family protein